MKKTVTCTVWQFFVFTSGQSPHADSTKWYQLNMLSHSAPVWFEWQGHSYVYLWKWTGFLSWSQSES